jgi:hypothetical protein
MKPSTLALALGAQLGAILLAFGVQRAVTGGSASGLPFIVGGIFGTQLGALRHARLPGSGNDARARGTLSAVLCVGALACGLGLQVAIAPFVAPEITLGFAAVGSAVFPWVLFNQMWRAVRPKG